jgi:hypothetical protein
MAADESPPESRRDRGFKERKREDHALALINELKQELKHELKQNLGDITQVRRILRELGRYYDPVLGGAIMEVVHQRAIVGALERGNVAEALAFVEQRYELYIKDRAHLGREDPP